MIKSACAACPNFGWNVIDGLRQLAIRCIKAGEAELGSVIGGIRVGRHVEHVSLLGRGLAQLLDSEGVVAVPNGKFCRMQRGVEFVAHSPYFQRGRWNDSKRRSPRLLLDSVVLDEVKLRF